MAAFSFKPVPPRPFYASLFDHHGQFLVTMPCNPDSRGEGVIHWVADKTCTVAHLSVANPDGDEILNVELDKHLMIGEVVNVGFRLTQRPNNPLNAVRSGPWSMVNPVTDDDMEEFGISLMALRRKLQQ